MLLISKPLSAAHLRRYFADEFCNARDGGSTSTNRICSQWHGRLAREWGLEGEVLGAPFDRLAEGRHPTTSEPLVRHRAACTYRNAQGRVVVTMTHRAGWDAVWRASKSASLTALVGGDDRVRRAHIESVTVALAELERYVQARVSHDRSETTRQWVAARFEHETARPVDGYPAPHLHTHVVVFNMTRRANGETRPLQTRELYRTQAYATAVYRSALAARLIALGYEIERGANGQPEIRGYSSEYLEASSPRQRQIELHLAREHRYGRGATEIAAYRTREPKRGHAHDAIQAHHRALAEALGDQPARVVGDAQSRAQHQERQVAPITALAAITFAKKRNLELNAVVDERTLFRDALWRSLGHASLPDIRAEFDARVRAGEFVAVEQPPAMPSRRFTSREMLAVERDTIQRIRDGQSTQAPLAAISAEALARSYSSLTPGQRAAIQQVLRSRDQILALDGVAGAERTNALTALRVEAERRGYRVKGLAPTPRAAQRLRDAGLAPRALQEHLAPSNWPRERRPCLYVLDESNLVSTRQLHTVVHRLQPRERMLLVGDVSRRPAFEAGRAYQNLQQAGMQTARLDTSARQQASALKAVLEPPADRRLVEGRQRLEAQKRVYGQHALELERH